MSVVALLIIPFWKKQLLNRMKDIVSRKDVTKENVVDLRNSGFTIKEIAKKLNCGCNTVYRRLGMKS